MKNKKPTVDAKRTKNALLYIAKRLGKRKRVRAGELFELVIEAIEIGMDE
jgi:hypothetical protein